MGASDITTAQVVAVKPGTTVPQVGRGDERFRVAKGAPHVILELVQADPKHEARVRGYGRPVGREWLPHPRRGPHERRIERKQGIILELQGLESQFSSRQVERDRQPACLCRSRRRRKAVFRKLFSRMVAMVREKGIPAGPDEIASSGVVLPPPDIKLEEAKELFAGDGLILD